MIWPILGAKAIAALLCLRPGLWRAAAFLATSLASDLLRLIFSDLRRGLPRPFVGRGLLLWLPDPALVLALPGALLAWAFGWRVGAMAWISAFTFVVLSYPGIRGDTLMRVYLAMYGASCLAVSFESARRSFARRISRDEMLLALFAASGLCDVVLNVLFRSAPWWGVWVINGGSYMTTVASVAVWSRKKSLP